MPDIKKEAPVSQKTPPTSTATTANKTADPNAPKLESTGVTKTPTGETEKADSSTDKSGVITGDKAQQQEAMDNKEERVEEASNEPFEKHFSSIEGEVLQGDSFRITLKRGNRTIKIPVPVTGSNNITILANTFRLIKEVQNTATEKELYEKFNAFVS